MPIEEKLRKCIEFIREISDGNKSKYSVYVNAEDINVSGDFQCDECGSYDIVGSAYVGLPAELRDRAWHLLADIDGLFDVRN